MRRLRAGLREIVHSEDGLATSAIAIPGTILLVILALQAALWYMGNNVAHAAATAAYSSTRAFQSTTNSGLGAADQVLAQTGQFISEARVELDRTATNTTVTVTGRAISLIPGLQLPAISQSVTGPTERWVPRT